MPFLSLLTHASDSQKPKVSANTRTTAEDVKEPTSDHTTAQRKHHAFLPRLLPLLKRATPTTHPPVLDRK